MLSSSSWAKKIKFKFEFKGKVYAGRKSLTIWFQTMHRSESPDDGAHS